MNTITPTATATTRSTATETITAPARSRRRPLAATLALALLPLTATTAGATQDAGPMLATAESPTSSSLTRVGTHYVRSDNLTGNGVAAPAWVTTGSAQVAGPGPDELASEASAPAFVPPVPGTLEWSRHGL